MWWLIKSLRAKSNCADSKRLSKRGVLNGALLCITFLSLSSLHGCGWHLRSASPLQAELQHIAILTSQPTAVSAALSKKLRFSGATISADADTQLQILNETYTKKSSTISTSGSASSFIISYAVDFSLAQDGKVLLNKQTIERKKYIQYSSIGFSQEEETIKRQMAEDISQQILRRIHAVPIAAKTTQPTMIQEEITIIENNL